MGALQAADRTLTDADTATVVAQVTAAATKLGATDIVDPARGDVVQQVRDLTGGFKCFRRKVLETIDLGAIQSEGYAFQIELTYRARKAGFRIVEVPIIFPDRTRGASKMSGPLALRDAWIPLLFLSLGQFETVVLTPNVLLRPILETSGLVAGRDFALGYSHPVVFDVPNGLDVAVDKQTHITVTGIDRQLVGQVAANIRRLRKPDPYKQKGVRYTGEVLKKKVGKTGA